MAAAYGVRLAAIAFTAATLRGAVCGESAAPCLARALLTAVLAFAAGLAVGGLVGRLAAEQAVRDAASTERGDHGD